MSASAGPNQDEALLDGVRHLLAEPPRATLSISAVRPHRHSQKRVNEQLPLANRQDVGDLPFLNHLPISTLVCQTWGLSY